MRRSSIAKIREQIVVSRGARKFARARERLQAALDAGHLDADAALEADVLLADVGQIDGGYDFWWEARRAA